MAPADPPAPPRTRNERKDAGKALRGVVSRDSLADFRVDPKRDPLPILMAGDAARVASLVPERYKRMAASPFAFYRGAAALMAHDLAPMPRIGLPVQACGDCHLMNFGAFSSPEGNILFDINDFDETYPGVDFVVDLKRLAASVAVAAGAAEMSDDKARGLARTTVSAYRDFMSYLAERSPLEVWETRMDLRDQVKGLGDANLETDILATLAKAEKKGKSSAEQPSLDKSGRRFADDPPFVFHELPDGTPVRRLLSGGARVLYESTLRAESAALLHRYALRDVAFKVVGVGSVGTYCAISLWTSADGDPIVLQMKEARASTVAGLAAEPSAARNQGKRVVDGQRALQAASDVFLGWTQDEDGRQFYLRRLKNRRLGSIGEVLEGKALPAYATLCGRTLARAHARTGDPSMISGYLGGSDAADTAIAAFAMVYASQTICDHAKLAASPLVPHEATKAS